MTEVAIVGAGPAGLMAAWQAAEAGHEVTVFEGSSDVGGMSASFSIEGQRVDYGSHRLHPSTPPHLLEAIRSLLGEDLQTRQRNGRIRLYDKWVAFPLRTADLFRHLPLKFSISSAFDIVRRPFLGANEDTFQHEVTRRLGKTVSDEFYTPYAEKLWGFHPSKIDSELARRRVSASSPLTILRRLIKSSSPSGRAFLYPRNGYGQIVEAIADAVISAGGKIELNSPVQQIHLNDGDCHLESINGRHIAELVWTTSPLNILPTIVRPKPDKNVTEAAAALRVRGMVLVYLVLDQPQFTEFDAHYFPGLDTRIARLSEPKNYRDGSDPKDQTILCAELPCWKTDAIWSASNEELGNIVSDDLIRLGLPKMKLVTTEVRRLPSVYPVFESSTREERKTLLQWGNSLGRLSSFGRQGLIVPDNIHHTLAMGWDAAHALSKDGEFNDLAWSTALNRFESHVVED
jgi:protoporphyrinogen oxidase